MLKNRKSGGTCCVGGHAAVGALAAVGGVAHFTCNFSIWVGVAAGGSCCAFLGGGTCCAPKILLKLKPYNFNFRKAVSILQALVLGLDGFLPTIASEKFAKILPREI